MRVVAIIQARMGSTRLPGKSMLPLAGKPLVQNVVERVMRAEKIDEVCLAVPSTEADKDMACKVGTSLGNLDKFSWVTGPEDDLVDRLLWAADISRADIIVRVCADNPCIEPEYIDEAVRLYLKYPNVFYSNTIVQWKDGLWVDGVGCEVFSMSRLLWLDQATQGCPAEREHPHLRFQDTGCIDWWDAYMRSSMAKHVRLDVNTQQDYDFIQDIYDHFGHNRFHVSEVLSYLSTKGVTSREHIQKKADAGKGREERLLNGLSR